MKISSASCKSLIFSRLSHLICGCLVQVLEKGDDFMIVSERPKLTCNLPNFILKRKRKGSNNFRWSASGNPPTLWWGFDGSTWAVYGKAFNNIRQMVCLSQPTDPIQFISSKTSINVFPMIFVCRAPIRNRWVHPKNRWRASTPITCNPCWW